jgi:hypothetical protein
VPFRQIHDRWIDKYTAPMSAMLTRLKKDIEEENVVKVYESTSRPRPDRLWQAIIDPALDRSTRSVRRGSRTGRRARVITRARPT